MILIIGLGNPGEKFKNTRHNIGFEIIDAFAEKNNFPEFKLSKKYNALISENFIEDKKIILAKPQTFMNNSGETAQRIVSEYKLPLENIYLVHDDLDIILGKIKIAQKRGPAGHKGVESVIQQIKTKNFTRIRIGIKPETQNIEKSEIFVLRKFTKEEKSIIKKITLEACEAMETILKKGTEQAMLEHNRK